MMAMSTRDNMEYISKKDVMEEIYHYFKNDEKMILLIGDMGFAVLDKFTIGHPERAFNVGIAEQATVSIAAGMYLAGLVPIVYSQVPFLTMRSYEQIRYDLCEHMMNVKMVGVGVDNYFSQLGRSHCMDDDDLKMMSIFKNLLILTPNQNNLKEQIQQMFEYSGPVYLRCK